MFSPFQILRISASRGMGLTLYCTLAGFCLLCSSCTFMQNRLAENLKNSDSVRLFRYFCSKSSETFKKRFTPLFESFTRCQRRKLKSSDFGFLLCFARFFEAYEAYIFGVRSADAFLDLIHDIHTKYPAHIYAVLTLWMKRSMRLALSSFIWSVTCP